MIVDTGATYDSTELLEGTVNMKITGAEDTVTESNGEEMRKNW